MPGIPLGGTRAPSGLQHEHCLSHGIRNSGDQAGDDSRARIGKDLV